MLMEVEVPHERPTGDGYLYLDSTAVAPSRRA